MLTRSFSWLSVVAFAMTGFGLDRTANALPPRTQDAASPTRPEACGSTIRIVPGDSFADVSRRCYGSRTYSDWLAAHNHHGKKSLRAGEKLEIPRFEKLVDERLAIQWKSQLSRIAKAYEHFHAAEDEIGAQLHAAKPGMGTYRPSAEAKANLDKAAALLHGIAKHLKKANAKTQKFSQAEEMISALANGGSFSTDYALEEIHQCFSYGVDALH